MIPTNVHRYCCEDVTKIENYDLAIADDSQTWDLHHRLEINDGYLNSREELKMMNLYYDRPAAELIFLTRSDHMAMHMKQRTGSRNPLFGRTGENSPFYGKFRGENSGMYGKGYLISGEKHPRYGVFGDKNPCWKADSEKPLTIYNRGYQMYKRGEITDEEFQKYRDIRAEYMRSIGGKKRIRIRKCNRNNK